jgi:Domain of unknown function (DUF6933)
MALIMCTQKLLRARGKRGRPPREATKPQLLGVQLGGWAATYHRFDRRDLVITLDQRTYLTLVFPLAPRSGFRARFAGALADALEDFGVPEDVVCAERSAIDFEPLTPLADRTLVRSLDDVEYMCGIELLYHDDLRLVQRNLNEFPHPGRDPCVPLEAVVQMIAAPRPAPSRLRH